MASIYPQWLNILKWSLSHSDGTTQSEARVMSEEDRTWLTKVLKECVKDESSRMLEITKEFISFQDKGLSKDLSVPLCELLDELRDIVEQIDMAQIFSKYGGVVSLLEFLKSDVIDDTVRVKSAAVIATLAQNNPIVQVDMISRGVLEQLISLITPEVPTSISKKVLG